MRRVGLPPAAGARVIFSTDNTLVRDAWQNEEEFEGTSTRVGW